MTILGIESSCDDTSAAVIRDGALLANVLAGQEVHRLYGGVIPELASRAHQQNIIPVTHRALAAAGLSTRDIDAIAFTRGPGLMVSLLVGASFVKGLSLATGAPLVEVNHLQGRNFIPFYRPAGKDLAASGFSIPLSVGVGRTSAVNSCAEFCGF